MKEKSKIFNIYKIFLKYNLKIHKAKHQLSYPIVLIFISVQICPMLKKLFLSFCIDSSQIVKKLPKAEPRWALGFSSYTLIFFFNDENILSACPDSDLTIEDKWFANYH